MGHHGLRDRIAEQSHRGKVFDKVLEHAEAACRKVAGIPANYEGALPDRRGD